MTVSASSPASISVARTAAQIHAVLDGKVEYSYKLNAGPGHGDALAAILKAHGVTDCEAVRLELVRQDVARYRRYPRMAGTRGLCGLPILRPVILHAGHDTVHAHLEAVRIGAAEAAVRGTLRTGDGLSVRLSDDPAAIGAVYSRRSLGRYSSRCSYTQWETTLTVTVPTRWRVRVERRGLAVVDGMFTFDAAPADYRIEGVEVFAATWCEQGRGYSVSLHHGFIARAGEVACHADTAAKAVAGLRRKAAWSKLDAAEKQARVAHLTDWVARAERYPQETPVCVSDARATGACEYGIRSWCHRTGIDYEAGCATLAQVLAAYAEYPLPEVRAAVLHALRGVQR